MANITVRHLLFLFLVIIAFAIPSSHGLDQSLSKLSSSSFSYHGGALLTGPSPISISIIWYGSFPLKERIPITDFFASFGTISTSQNPTVSTWWKTLESYKDKAKKSVSSTIRITKQIGDITYSLGKNIKRDQIASYIKTKIDTKKLPVDPHGTYLFFTSKDVIVEHFCMGSCGFHDSLVIESAQKLVYAHVGDPTRQCPGLCSWPFAIPAYGPPGPPLVAPNGIGSDGMVMNIATILAGAATNPFKNGYFQGDALAPLEAVSACPGIFGSGAYPGYPGNLMVDKISKASYNAYGANGRKFLLPAMWDLVNLNCEVLT
ncbi:Protein EXORDIUM-like [Dillenia turbinata]|uniref:Protein EXORDIUM-like n=1 Tax=Dillenia turbinata TaxID=194707 RepID=A0AAN8VU02_9MAGN